MAKWISRIVKWVLGAAVLLLVLGWMLLAAPFFSGFRRGIVETVLSEQIGQPLHVKDDVSVVPGPISRITVARVVIPSENIPDTNLAELNFLELDLNLVELLNGHVDLDNLTVDGLQLNMLTQADGTTSWTPRNRTAKPKTETAENAQTEAPDSQKQSSGGILGFLRHRTVSFTSIGLTIDNRVSGFSFVFDLENLNLDQLNDGNRLGVTSLGSVNGQVFEIEGSYPTGAPFTTQAKFGELKLNFDGSAIPPDQGGGFTGTLDLDTGEFGDFLDVIGLDRVLEGTGKLSADLTSQSGALKISNLSAVVDLAEGQQIKAEGSVENLLEADGFDVAFNARFHPKGQPPEPAKELKDLKLAGISAHIVSEGQSLEFDELLLATNAFDQGLDQVGPVSIGRVRRTPEGQLALEDISLQAGPRDAPYIVAKGNILNLLQLIQLDLSGKLAAPASLVLKGLGDDVAEAFGGVEADFAVDDAQGFISLNKLDAYTVNTEVWALKAHVALGNVIDIDGLEFDFDLDITDGAQFLGALKLEEVDTGPLEISASALGQGKEFSTKLGLAAGTSRLEASLETTVTEGRPQIDGLIFSDRLDIDDLKNAIAGVVQLGRIGETDEVGVPEADKPEEPEVQPLVLPKEEGKPTDLVDFEKLFLDTDLTVLIDIKEITGQLGVSSVSSEFIARDGQAHLGPLEVTYGGGYFKIEAKMDLLETPELLSVSGATGGWDFGKILDAVGLSIDAHGKLRGRFDVTGNRSSISTFINSMYGSASISMSKGDVATSLLELAGLGIFPWLFSEELHQGYTDIVCVVAPVRINAGNVTFDSLVAETASVQLVARGTVNWRKDTIALRAEPRRVGKPLARSAWPFEVTGKLSEPNFKMDIGGSRSKRTDGADEMPTDRKPCVPDLEQLE
ncbi:AsmA family protein [Parasedimentitalea psychrophila]|uniref:AsmA-like C-terminal region-containing protein n=1 Tax=Parasedimentitalea psychrophila TaxID=2997337 RepID=A0A9Y2KXS1_9RHOB|nr:AsmA-like C-terminal region-containing protein [Parasedimentitalea psychrophila]WIY24265.1 AsmA-like C-terminal region-containing protein [Parasedimentitalea psychrophila]